LQTSPFPLHPPIFSSIFIGVILLYILNTVLPIVLLLLLSSFFNVLIHELGHAIPVLLTTPGSATIYIGSYGDRNKSVGFRIGRIKFWIKYNPFRWFWGMCQPGGAYFSINQQILYVSAGPLASILLGSTGCALLMTGSFPGAIRFWLGFIVFFAALGLLGSCLPTGRARYTASGAPVYPDLLLAIRLWRSKRLV
jgi:hypothetical protein